MVNLHGNGSGSREWLEAVAPDAVRIGHAGGGWNGPVWREHMHERRRWTEVLRWHGIAADPCDLRLPSPAGSVEAGASAYALVHVGASSPSRHWPTDKFAHVAAAIVRRGMRVVVSGNEFERARADAVVSRVSELGGAHRLRNVAGRQSLAQLCATVAAADLVVSADTGVAHLASAFGRPSVVIFGPVPPEEWGPPPGPHRVLTVAHLRKGDVQAAEPDPALSAVSAADVVRAIESLCD